MSDVHTPKIRSYNMSRIRGSNTKPEKRLRSLLHSKGLRFRINDRRLLGSPDIVLPRFHAVIFVNGCFWHRHPGCRYATTPATRREFWEKKFAGTVERDMRVYTELSQQGWTVYVVWECELRTHPEETAERLTTRVRSKGDS